MGTMAQAAKFTSTHGGHQHLDTPTIHYGEAPPDPGTTALSPGDLWVETVPLADR